MTRFASHEIIRSYLQDAVAAEEHHENHLREFAAEARREPAIQELFSRHAEETRRQAAWLKMRLDTLHGAPSGIKSLRAQLTWLGPKLGLLGHDPVERIAQNLMAAYTVECGEIAMYEALAEAAATAGDAETERLARGIQEEERRMAERIWDLLDASVHAAFVRLTGTDATERPEEAPLLPSAAFPGTTEMPDYPGAAARVERPAAIWTPPGESAAAPSERVAVLEPEGPDV